MGKQWQCGSGLIAVALGLAMPVTAQEARRFVGGLEEPGQGLVAVRNDVNHPGEEIVTLRYFRIEKGSFDRFVQASREGVWPYFEKLGARVIGMWKVVGSDGPPVPGDAEDKAFDEVYLATRYASVEHWHATRETVRHGGNGPDWEACRAALELRRSLTQQSHVLFLQGQRSSNGPYFMPGLGEQFRLVEE